MPVGGLVGGEKNWERREERALQAAREVTATFPSYEICYRLIASTFEPRLSTDFTSLKCGALQGPEVLSYVAANEMLAQVDSKSVRADALPSFLEMGEHARADGR